MDDEQCDVCWICFEQGASYKPCRCPTVCHQQCLVLWQIHSFGKQEEKQCRFCKQDFQRWQDYYKHLENLDGIQALMEIRFEDKSYKIFLKPSETYADFRERIKKYIGVDADKVKVEFECKLHPNMQASNSSCNTVVLEGLESFEAALTLACITAKYKSIK